jgi:hypothetical protein
MTKEKATPFEKEAALKALRDEFKGNDADTQRQRLKEAFLRFVTLTTLEIRRWLDILHPAGRVRELRHEGLDIVTLRQPQETEAGVKHIVGLYVYRAGSRSTEATS